MSEPRFNSSIRIGVLIVICGHLYTLLMGINRRLVLASVLISGCAKERGPDYYKPPSPIPLQDPLPGQGLLYLFRAPYDSDAFTVELSGRKPFLLKPSTYAVLSLAPGEYQITGITKPWLGSVKPAFAPAHLRLSPNQRAFLYVSGRTSSSAIVPAVIPIGSGVLSLGTIPVGQSTDPESRRWSECSEMDAQGFLSISTRVDAE
jgi:hypothetical protein